jgi:hypothetical protein
MHIDRANCAILCWHEIDITPAHEEEYPLWHLSPLSSCCPNQTQEFCSGSKYIQSTQIYVLFVSVWKVGVITD